MDEVGEVAVAVGGMDEERERGSFAERERARELDMCVKREAEDEEVGEPEEDDNADDDDIEGRRLGPLGEEEARSIASREGRGLMSWEEGSKRGWRRCPEEKGESGTPPPRAIDEWEEDGEWWC